MNMQNIFAALDMMWKGMLGIFTVIIIIMIIVMIMTRFSKDKEDN